MSSELDRQGLVEIFVIEASEAVDMLTKAFHPTDGTTPTPAQLQEQYVWAHKIRGASGLYGYEGLAMMGALLESTLEEGASIEASLWPKALDILRGMVTSFESQLKVVAQGGAEDLSVSARWKREVAGLFPSVPAAASPESILLAPGYLVPTLDAEVLSYFTPEANEYLQSMESFVHRLRQDAKDLLSRKGVKFHEIDVTGKRDVRKEMIQRAHGRSTYPQIFIGATHVGGCADLYALEEAGKLDSLLVEAKGSPA